MTLKELESQIRKFLSGQKEDHGEALFNRWYDSFENEKTDPSPDNKAQIKKRIYQNIKIQIDQSVDEPIHTVFHRRRFRLIGKIAATIAILVVGYLGFQIWYEHQELQFLTTYGETQQIALSDGTQVVLNANSSLRFVRNNPREVWLDGEAFFDVMKKPQSGAQFHVHTQDLIIEVLGTAFNVNSRHEKTKVVLEEGSIKLNLQNGGEEMMKPGDLISYSGKKAKILERKSSLEANIHSSWKDGFIQFNQIPLEEALGKVADHYGIRFQIDSEHLKTKEVGGGAPMHNLELCLLGIEKTFNVTIEYKGTHYLITPQNTPE